MQVGFLTWLMSSTSGMWSFEVYILTLFHIFSWDFNFNLPHMRIYLYETMMWWLHFWSMFSFFFFWFCSAILFNSLDICIENSLFKFKNFHFNYSKPLCQLKCFRHWWHMNWYLSNRVDYYLFSNLSSVVRHIMSPSHPRNCSSSSNCVSHDFLSDVLKPKTPMCRKSRISLHFITFWWIMKTYFIWVL